MAILTSTTRLFGMFVLLLDSLGHGLAIGHLRLPNITVNTKLALETIDDDFKVKLAHAGNNGLARLFISPYLE